MTRKHWELQTKSRIQVASLLSAQNPAGASDS
jgi:hypothetical protein